MMKTLFVLIIVFIQAGCSSLVNVKREQLYHPLVNLHIEDVIDITPSPFSKIINDVFDKRNLPNGKGRHYISILDSGDDALLARLHMIRHAQKAIYIQTFIWRNDESGRLIIKELIDAARRGVAVYIIADKLGIDDDPHLIAYFADAHENIHIKLYNPSAERVTPSAIAMAGQIVFKFKKFNQRMHNKIMVFDDQIAITGGRNFENDYFDRNATRNFRDRDVLVAGPAVKTMTDSFMKYWAFKWSVNVRDFIDVKKSIKNRLYEKFIDDKMFRFGKLFSDIVSRSDDLELIDRYFVKNMFHVRRAEFKFDEPGKNDKKTLKGGGEVSRDVIELLKSAQKNVVFQTPYLVLDEKTMKTFNEIRRKNSNLDFRISTNSLASTDKIYAYAYSFKQRKQMIKGLKFRIFELKPVPEDMDKMMPHYDRALIRKYTKDKRGVFSAAIDKMPLNEDRAWMCVHAKSFVIDDEIAWIGSLNLDPRSFHLNTEVGLTVWDKGVAQLLKEDILRDMSPQNSWTVGKKLDFPIVSQITDIVGTVVEKIPIVDAWPFEYSSLYQLKAGHDEIPYYDREFFKRYQNVGSFPEVGISTKRIQLRLIESIGGFAEPLI